MPNQQLCCKGALAFPHLMLKQFEYSYNVTACNHYFIWDTEIRDDVESWNLLMCCLLPVRFIMRLQMEVYHGANAA